MRRKYYIYEYFKTNSKRNVIVHLNRQTNHSILCVFFANGGSGNSLFCLATARPIFVTVRTLFSLFHAAFARTLEHIFGNKIKYPNIKKYQMSFIF